MRVGEVIGDYELVRGLGRGGMGVVYVARHRRLDRLVALKLLAPEVSGDENLRARLRQEARTLASLSNPHIIVVHDYGEVAGQVFLAMQLIDGPSLGQVLNHQLLTSATTCSLGAQVADALGAAHAAGVLHRDVKPSNVLTSGGHFAWLADFGIARLVHHTEVPDGHVWGVQQYSAPERLHGAPASPASDAYSLGCLVLACLVGRPPWWPPGYALPTDLVAAMRRSGAGPLVGLLGELLAPDPRSRPAELHDVARRLRRGSVELPHRHVTPGR